MPIRKVGDGYQWGNSGKVYRGPNARKKAAKQAAAAYANGYREGWVMTDTSLPLSEDPTCELVVLDFARPLRSTRRLLSFTEATEVGDRAIAEHADRVELRDPRDGRLIAYRELP